MATKKKKKRLVRGKDFDAWATRDKDGKWRVWPVGFGAPPDKDWVRVKFVEVK